MTANAVEKKYEKCVNTKNGEKSKTKQKELKKIKEIGEIDK